MKYYKNKIKNYLIKFKKNTKFLKKIMIKKIRNKIPKMNKNKMKMKKILKILYKICKKKCIK